MIIIGISAFLLGLAAGMLWRDRQADRERLRSSRAEANRAIDEYERIHGIGSSGWPKFK